MTKDADVLMITYNRPHYLLLTLKALVEAKEPSARLWVWQNSNDEQTSEIVRQYRSELFAFHQSPFNAGLTEPTNWLFKNAKGRYLSKVDDDCIVSEGWLAKLREAHESEPRFGVIGCWHFAEEDFVPEIATRKIRTFAGGYRLLVNLWVGGSGYVMKRACIEKLGLLRERESFTDYCIRIGRSGWVNGWLYPLVLQEHLDDPRAQHSGLRSDSDFKRYEPLSAKLTKAADVDAWLRQLKQSARYVQSAPIDPRYWSPTRRRIRNFLNRIGKMRNDR